MSTEPQTTPTKHDKLVADFIEYVKTGKRPYRDMLTAAVAQLESDQREIARLGNLLATTNETIKAINAALEALNAVGGPG